MTQVTATTAPISARMEEIITAMMVPGLTTTDEDELADWHLGVSGQSGLTGLVPGSHMNGPREHFTEPGW